VGVLAAWLQLGEVPTLVEGIGMALIIAALAVLAGYGLLAGRGKTAADDEPPVRPVID
jgi:drug/metabolite transporter (DMT)-like permease